MLPLVPARRGSRWLQGWGRADRRWRDLPLRTRLTTVAALSAMLAIVAVVAVAYLAVRHELRAQIDNQLRRQATEVEVLQEVGPLGLPRPVVRTRVADINGFVQLVNARGQIQGARGQTLTLPVSAADLHVATVGAGHALHDGRTAGMHVRILTTPLKENPGVAVQLALPLTEVDHQLREVAAAFLVLALGGLTLTVLLSWGAVRRTTRPVRELTEATERIAATRDLSVRIDVDANDELGRLATTFNTMLDELDRSVTAQRQLVTDASHELRTPLASLRTNVEVLNDLDRLTGEQRRAVLDGIVTQLDELTGLVADVVELARGEAPPSDHTDVAFDDLVGHAVERARRHWPTVDFRATVTPVTVRGVPGRLDRAVANMLDNAGKFSPPGATVDVELSSDGTLTVADRGPGVPDEALPHVFDRFYRADEARALPGSGLGLAIAQQVADGHGGSIVLANRPDGGAVATLRLPPTSVTAEMSPPTGSVPLPVEPSVFR